MNKWMSPNIHISWDCHHTFVNERYFTWILKQQPGAAYHVRQLEEKELKRKKIASWYVMLPGIPVQEKRKLEKSLKYNVWSSLIRFMILYFIFSCVWLFGVGRYDPFGRVTGYPLVGKKPVTAVVQEDGTSASVKDPNEGEPCHLQLNGYGH